VVGRAAHGVGALQAQREVGGGGVRTALTQQVWRKCVGTGHWAAYCIMVGRTIASSLTTIAPAFSAVLGADRFPGRSR
jgi:hypothetical protein